MKSVTMHFSTLIIGGDIYSTLAFPKAHFIKLLYPVCCSLNTYKVLYAPYIPTCMQLKVVMLKNNRFNFEFFFEI